MTVKKGLALYRNGEVYTDDTVYTGSFNGSFTTGGSATGTHQDNALIGRSLLAMAINTSGDYGGPDLTLNSATGVISWSYTLNLENETAPPIPSDTIFYGGY